MRWQAGINYQTMTPPRVTLAEKPGSGYAPEVKIDLRGAGVYLSIAEARQLAADLTAAVPTPTAVPKSVRDTPRRPGARSSGRNGAALGRSLSCSTTYPNTADSVTFPVLRTVIT